MADFTWAAAGPLTTMHLSCHGAEVVRIESSTRVDLTRTAAPFKDKKPGVNRAGWYLEWSSSKYGVTLNLNHPLSKEVTRRLIAWADIVAENFAPGVMQRWGLGYDEVRQVNPDVIYVSLSNQGQTGPHASQPSYGTQLSALSGFYELTGWPDRIPAETYGAYTDYASPGFAVTAIVAALDYRDRTGRGQHIDYSQFEGGVNLLAPVVLDYVVNRREWHRRGNYSSYDAPHGAYRCRGEDRWCAIAVSTDEEWSSFIRVLGRPDWTRDRRFANAQGRIDNSDELDALVEVWTINHNAEEVMSLMQAEKVSAGVVETGEDMHRDPQFAHRRHLRQLNNPEIGAYTATAPAFALSETPAELRPAPMLGQDNYDVYTRLLGFSDQEFAQYLTEGVFD